VTLSSFFPLWFHYNNTFALAFIINIKKMSLLQVDGKKRPRDPSGDELPATKRANTAINEAHPIHARFEKYRKKMWNGEHKGEKRNAAKIRAQTAHMKKVGVSIKTTVTRVTRAGGGQNVPESVQVHVEKSVWFDTTLAVATNEASRALNCTLNRNGFSQADCSIKRNPRFNGITAIVPHAMRTTATAEWQPITLATLQTPVGELCGVGDSLEFKVGEPLPKSESAARLKAFARKAGNVHQKKEELLSNFMAARGDRAAKAYLVFMDYNRDHAQPMQEKVDAFLEAME
jgi:hypothetical protein